MDDEDFVNFCGLLRKHELYLLSGVTKTNMKSSCEFLAEENDVPTYFKNSIKFLNMMK